MMGSREESLGRESEDLHLNDEGASDKDRGVVGKIAVHARSVVPDSVTLWTVTRQAPLSVGFSRQEYWKWLPFPTPGNLLNSGVKTLLLNWQVGSLALEPPRKPLVVLDGIEHVQIWREAFFHGRGKEKPLSGIKLEPCLLR